MKKPVIKIEIISDVVCPWCYIGKRRLEKAIRQSAEQYDFEVSWLPFELNPDMPKSGVPQAEYLMDKFGGEERYRQLTGHVRSVADTEGLVFDYSKQKTIPNTRDAHRVLWAAGQEGKQAAVKEAFMKAYFTDGVDLSIHENLIMLATGAGLDKEKITSLLKSDEGTAEVVLSEQTSVQRGVSGVPFYIVNGKYGISGAQTPEVFKSAFEEIALS